MRISIEKAAGRFEELIERAERGESVVLTRNDQPTAVLQAVNAAELPHDATLSPDEKDQRLAAILNNVRGKRDLYPDVSAERSQDFLYDENGLPG